MSAHPWLIASRPKTLVAAIVPVIIGAAYAREATLAHWPFALCALLSALCIQIATNFANDYADFKSGADTEQRLGPVRVTQAGLIPPETVKRGAMVMFGAAVVFGIPLIARGGWPILVIGLLSIAAGWAYTSGPYPLGYNGLGELFVIVFFGLVAVAGTHYVLTLEFRWAALLVGLAPGLHAAALLAINNLRDINTDREAGKRTLAARYGRKFGRIEYALLLLLPFAVPVLLFAWTPVSPAVMLPAITFPLTLWPLRLAFRYKDGPSLIRALAGTARLQLIFGLAFAAGLAL